MLGVCLKYTQHNYGSKLQALATVKMFEELGIEYEIIRYNKKTLSFYLKSIPRMLNVVFLNDRYDEIQKKLELIKHPEIKEKVSIRDRYFDSFDSNFSGHLSEVYRSYGELKKKCASRYDGVITCSDQLWSPSGLGSGFYNLMFAPDEMKKFSWASSFGVSNIPWYQINRTRKYLNRIQYVSMRENRGAEIVKELTGRSVPVLMDPVFVFSRDIWDEMIPYQEPEWNDYMFCYFLGSNSEYRKTAEHFAESKHLKIVTLRHLDRYNARDEEFGDFAPYDVSPARFLNILRNAKYIMTDSFHGAAFSIIYGKQFVVCDRYRSQSSNSKNSRIESVCANLGLIDKKYENGKNLVQQMDREIAYTQVFDSLAEFRKKTIAYLQELKNVESETL